MAYVRVNKTTIAEQIKQEEVNIVRLHKLLSLMEEKGQITFNHSGNGMEWNVRVSRNKLTPYGDGQPLSFPRVNRHELARLPYCGYVLSEGVGKKEKLQAKSPEARINVIADLTQRMIDDIRHGFGYELYVDGNATGNENRIHGFGSFLGYTGSDQYTSPSDTYAGLSTALGALGGAVLSGSWPSGSFDSDYDAFSPLIVNYTHANWSSSTDNWANNCVEALRSGIIFAQNTRGEAQGMLDVIVMTADMQRQFRDKLDDAERIVVERNAQASKLVSMGFKSVINFDGVDTTFEEPVPPGEAYGIKIDQVELRSLQGQLFVPSEDYDLEALSDRYEIDFFGNLKCNPRGFVLWKNIT